MVYFRGRRYAFDVGILAVFFAAGFALAQEPATQPAGPEIIAATSRSELRLPPDDAAEEPVPLAGEQPPVSETEYYGSDALAAAAKACAAGRGAECMERYQKIAASSSTQEVFLALKNLAFIHYFNGEVKTALDYFDKASGLKANDPVIGLFRGWAYLSAGKNRQAVEAFQRAVSMADAPAVTSDSRIGEALALFFDRKFKDADKKLKAVYSTDPYTISFSAYMLGLLNVERGEEPSAEIYFEQALKHDSMNYSAAFELYKLYSKTGNYLRTWQTYSTLASLEPDAPEVGPTLARLNKKLDGNAARYFPRTRAGSPLNGFFRNTPSAPLNAALYADSNGTPARLLQLNFIAASSFAVCDLAAGPISRGKRGDNWTIHFNAKTREVAVLNNWGNVEYLSSQPFRLEPETRGAGILVKDAEAPGPLGQMLDDKELRGALTVIPDSAGFILVNNTTVEDFLPGAMMPLRFGMREPEALKALAVAIRTQITEAVRTSTGTLYNFCDSKACLLYGGINTEIQAAVQAVSATAGEVLDTTAPAGAFEACGGATEYGARDSGSTTVLPPGPAQLVQRILALPPADLLCAPRWATEWAADKWTVLIDADAVNARFKRLYKTRPVTAVSPLGWTRRGSVTAVEVKSRDKSFTLTPQEFNRLLAAGTLRSDFYYVIPIYDGSSIAYFLVRGIGTGSGRGLCAKGAQKAAESGYDYRTILKHYFPGTEIKS
ncbi:MAG: SpoIID/LytB domain-containing protein [Elusimicrobiaceae bacterium]|nr:SpoIID/LytB domain-containing protein [Elusimicrobiaceae bacterium]